MCASVTSSFLQSHANTLKILWVINLRKPCNTLLRILQDWTFVHSGKRKLGSIRNCMFMYNVFVLL